MSFVADTVRQIAAAPSRRAARGPRVEHLPGHDGRARPRAPRGLGAEVRPRTSFSRSLPSGKTRATRASRPRRIPKVVGGMDPVSGRPGAGPVRPGRSSKRCGSLAARTAEATKLVENIFRAVNIALVNELKIVFDRMGIDVWEVLDAASTKPFGFMRFNPGPGWGGHCIPLDPFYLVVEGPRVRRRPRSSSSWRARSTWPDARLRRREDPARPQSRGAKPFKGSRILVLGLAYKKDIDDPRESPAFEIIDRLLKSEADRLVPRPVHRAGPPDAVVARPASDDVGIPDGRTARRPGRRRHRDRPFRPSTTSSCPGTRPSSIDTPRRLPAAAANVVKA